VPKLGRRDLEITTKNQRVRSDGAMVNWYEQRRRAHQEDVHYDGQADSDRSSGTAGNGRALYRSVHQITIAPD
jgi:hypothetical protein